MKLKYFQSFVGILLLALGMSACTVSEADCDSDSDCQSGFYCASSGGVLFGGGICIKKAGPKPDDLLDTTDLFDTTNDTLHNPDSTDDTTIPRPEDDVQESTTDQQCVLDEDCAPPEEGSWSTCDGFEDPCAITGTQTRQIRTSSCVDGFCTAKTTTKQRECNRETNETSCGATTESEWSDCAFDGKKSREVSSPTCQNAQCESVLSTEEVPCNCTSNASCGEPIHGSWSACNFESTCATSGTKTREVKTPTCQGTSCTLLTTSETTTCTRQATTGNSCGVPTTAEWSSCTDTNSNTCATSGKRTQQIHTPTCQNDACVIVTTSNTENCALSPPTSCGTVTHSSWGTCEFPANSCTTTGTQKRTVTTPSCQSGSCNNVTSTETQSCTRTAPTGSCGTPTFSNWGTCEFPANNTCAASGTRSRTKTSPTCQSGSCKNVTSTETETCTRTAPTGSCGTVTHSIWSACTYPANNNICATSGTQTQTVTTPTCQGGTCKNVQTTASQSCGARVTNGTTCGPSNNPPWGLCQYPFNSCSNSGSAQRTVTTPTCNAGTCSSTKNTAEINHQMCERDSDGLSCSGPGQGGQMTLGTCMQGCCDVHCPPGDHTCLRCAFQ